MKLRRHFLRTPLVCASSAGARGVVFSPDIMPTTTNSLLLTGQENRRNNVFMRLSRALDSNGRAGFLFYYLSSVRNAGCSALLSFLCSLIRANNIRLKTEINLGQTKFYRNKDRGRSNSTFLNLNSMYRVI